MMDNYKELIDELRTCAEMGWFCPCEMQNAADAIERLVTDIDVVRKERDALLSDFLKGFQAQVKKEHGIYRCDICKYGFENNPQENGCQKEHCDGYTNWEWRGVIND